MTKLDDFLAPFGFKSTYQVINPFSSDFPICIGHPESNFLEDKNYNEYYYRSDNFLSTHSGKHILFSGCSVTYGNSLHINNTWSKLLYDKISSKEQTSGYFNIGMSAQSILEMIIRAFKYIKKYGNPDIIFLNLPDCFRYYAKDDEENCFMHISRAEYEPENFILVKSLALFNYHYLMMFEEYCKSKNINLIYTTWEIYTEEFLRSTDLENFYILDKDILALKMLEYQAANPKDDYSLMAPDKKHQGHAYHYAWSEMLYDYYMGKVA